MWARHPQRPGTVVTLENPTYPPTTRCSGPRAFKTRCMWGWEVGATERPGCDADTRRELRLPARALATEDGWARALPTARPRPRWPHGPDTSLRGSSQRQECTSSHAGLAPGKDATPLCGHGIRPAVTNMVSETLRTRDSTHGPSPHSTKEQINTRMNQPPQLTPQRREPHPPPPRGQKTRGRGRRAPPLSAPAADQTRRPGWRGRSAWVSSKARRVGPMAGVR